MLKIILIEEKLLPYNLVQQWHIGNEAHLSNEYLHNPRQRQKWAHQYQGNEEIEEIFRVSYGKCKLDAKDQCKGDL